MDNYPQDPNGYQQPMGQQPYQQPPMGGPAPEDPGKGMGIASLVLGIAGLCTGWGYGVGCILGIIGIVLAVMSGNKSKEVGLKQSSLAIAGLVLSIIAVVLGAGCLICTVAAVGCSVCGGTTVSTASLY